MRLEVRNAGLLVLASTMVLWGATQLGGEIFLDFGPNDTRYVAGFREEFEIDEPTLIHWSTTRSTVRLPFSIRGPYDVVLRFKRHVGAPAEVRFFLDSELVKTIHVPQQDFTLETLRSSGTSGEFQLALVSKSNDPRPLGIALDWMLVRPACSFGALLPAPTAFAWLLSWVLAFYLVPRLLGIGRRTALLIGLGAMAALSSAAAANPLWPVHVCSTLGLRYHGLALALSAFFRIRRRSEGSFFSRPEAKWAALIVLFGSAIRLFALFHPDFYYPDVRTHSKFVSLIWTEGLSGFFNGYIENQHRHLLGLQLVGKEWLAFPYPPLLYLSVYPLSLLQLPVEDWMKLLPTVLVAIEALALFPLGQRLGLSPRAALIAVALHASARVVGFRLAVASYAALLGHFCDTLLVLYLVLFFERLGRPVYGAGICLLVAVSLLSYAGSALVLGLFVPLLCLTLLVTRQPWERAAAIAAWALAGALVALVSFYGQYVPELLGDRGFTSASGLETRGLLDLRLTPLDALWMSVHRARLFYLAPFGLVLVCGLAMMARSDAPILGKALAFAASGTFLGLNFLRSGLGATHIFQFSKDDLVILPVMVLVVGAAVDRLAQRRAAGKWLAAGVVVLWVGWGVFGLASDVRSRFIRPQYPVTSGSVHHPVSPGSLGAVESLVGELEQPDFVFGVRGKSAQTATRGQRP